MDTDDQYHGFVLRLLQTVAAANANSGDHERRVAQRISTAAVEEVPGGAPVLDARFALGGDSAAYLRTNVQPLHVETDESNLTRPSLQVEHATRAAFLQSVQEGIENRRGEIEAKGSLENMGLMRKVCNQCGISVRPCVSS